MTTPKTTAAKKPAAKRKQAVRKPTQAQQEKLTREELLALLEKTEPEQVAPNVDAFEASNPLSPEFSVPVPEAVAASAPTYYIRNLQQVPVSYRLARQSRAKGEERTNLKPRGSRGDIVKVEDGDLKDPVLSEQVGYGLVEIITEAEALSAVTKQAINQQTAVHPSMAYLRNENDQPYAPNAVSVQPEAGAAAISVGTVLPESHRSQNPIVRPGTDQGVTQFQQAPTLDGQARDAAIRANKQAEGIEAGLGGLTVAPIAPVQQSN